MSRRLRDPAPSRDRLPGGTLPWVVVAVVIVVAGTVATVVRPLAPDLGAVPDPSRWFGPDLLARIAAYRTPLRRAALVATAVDLGVPLVVAFTPAGRRLVSRIVRAVGVDRPARAAAAVGGVVVVAVSVVRLPVDAWAYRHARSFGLSTQSPGGWLGDRMIALGVDVVVVALVLLVGYALARRWPRHWVLVAAPAGLAAIAVATVVGPILIEPLRYDVTPLADGPTRRAVAQVLEADDRGDADVLVADASRRTTRQNAYVSGLWGTRRIVLYDTLLERPPPQVAQIVAHELAHDRHRDLLRGVLAGGAGLLVVCVLVDRVLRWRVRRGLQREPADPFGAGVVVAVVVVALVATEPVVAAISRRAEAAADAGALQLLADVSDYCAAQRGLVERNLSDPAPPEWARLWWWTHPPAASRLELASRVADDGCAPEGEVTSRRDRGLRVLSLPPHA